MVQISAVIITYNEARNIGRCLSSLQGIADEILVLDSFSTDTTEQICRQFGVRFEQHAFDGHIEQKNRALQLARFPIVLSLDADEALSDTLRASVLEAKQHWQTEACSMNRLTNYCGQWIRHSGWYPDRKTRLFDRSKGRWGGVNPHDKVEMAPGARTRHLEGDLLHYSYYTVQEHRERSLKYAQIAAQAMLQQGKKGHWWLLLIKPFAKFVRHLLVKRGFLDGRAGWTIAWISARETYQKYRLIMNYKL
jgi:glycosyltransferase involved in cell wall biosynthesis